MFEALEEVARQLEKDIPRAVVLTGAGDIAFCSGFDLGMDNPMTEEFLGAVKKKIWILHGDSP